MGELAFRELSVSLARRGEEYTSIATDNGGVEVTTDAREKLGTDSKPDPKAELTSALDFRLIPQTLRRVER